MRIAILGNPSVPYQHEQRGQTRFLLCVRTRYCYLRARRETCKEVYLFEGLYKHGYVTEGRYGYKSGKGLRRLNQGRIVPVSLSSQRDAYGLGYKKKHWTGQKAKTKYWKTYYSHPGDLSLPYRDNTL